MKNMKKIENIMKQYDIKGFLMDNFYKGKTLVISGGTRELAEPYYLNLLKLVQT